MSTTQTKIDRVLKIIENTSYQNTTKEQRIKLDNILSPSEQIKMIFWKRCTTNKNGYTMGMLKNSVSASNADVIIGNIERAIEQVKRD